MKVLGKEFTFPLLEEYTKLYKEREELYKKANGITDELKKLRETLDDGAFEKEYAKRFKEELAGKYVMFEGAMRMYVYVKKIKRVEVADCNHQQAWVYLIGDGFYDNITCKMQDGETDTNKFQDKECCITVDLSCGYGIDKYIEDPKFGGEIITKEQFDKAQARADEYVRRALTENTCLDGNGEVLHTGDEVYYSHNNRIVNGKVYAIGTNDVKCVYLENDWGTISRKKVFKKGNYILVG